MKKIKFLIPLFLMFALLLNFSCTQKEEDPVAPNLPPDATFIMNYDDFEDADTTNSKPYNNWFYSAGNVIVWNVVLTVNLAVPVASFYESFNHTPSYLGEFEWLWAYDVVVANQTYHANLYGQVVNSNVEWEMYVTKDGAYSNFLWYKGTVNSTNTEAAWTIYKAPNSPASGEFLLIDYKDDVGTGIEKIRYTKVEEVISTEASYIEYGNSTETVYNRFYNIYLQDQDKSTEIKWNFASKYGRVRDEVHFGDTDWHCWDEYLLDIICP